LDEITGTLIYVFQHWQKTNLSSDKLTLREMVTHACRFPVAFHSIDLDLTAKLET